MCVTMPGLKIIFIRTAGSKIIRDRTNSLYLALDQELLTSGSDRIHRV